MIESFNRFCLWYIRRVRTPGHVVLYLVLVPVLSIAAAIPLNVLWDNSLWQTVCKIIVADLVLVGALVNGLHLRSVRQRVKEGINE